MNRSSSKRYVTAADGAVAYVTIDGDVVDQIAHDYYGAHRGKTELVLDANPGLADRGVKLPAGLVVRLPTINTSPKPKAFRRLWD